MSLTFHKIGPRFQPPDNLTFLGAINSPVLTVPHVGRTGFIWPREGVVRGLDHLGC